jgi:cold shock CspA family protein
MADSFGKKDREKKRRKKREEKAERKAARREEESGSDIMYVHPDGSFHPTPPDLTNQVEIEAEDIVLGAQNNFEEDEDPVRKGKVSFFNHDKGFGFIVDSGNNQSVFTHIDSCLDEITENDKVVFEMKKGPKGMMAFNVQLKENYVPPVKELTEEEKKAAEAKAAEEGKDGEAKAEDTKETAEAKKEDASEEKKTEE